MQEVAEKVRAQLEFWSSRIDHMAARTQMSQGEPSFDALVQIDELKALLALAHAKLDAFTGSTGAEQPRRRRELNGAIDDLAVAIKDPTARRRP
jgi:hypothetical protein